MVSNKFKFWLITKFCHFSVKKKNLNKASSGLQSYFLVFEYLWSVLAFRNNHSDKTHLQGKHMVWLNNKIYSRLHIYIIVVYTRLQMYKKERHRSTFINNELLHNGKHLTLLPQEYLYICNLWRISLHLPLSFYIIM